LHTPIAECSARPRFSNDISDVAADDTRQHMHAIQRARMRILDRVLELLRAVDYATLQTKPVRGCGVSERTLRDIFNEISDEPASLRHVASPYEIRSAIHSAAPEDTITTYVRASVCGLRRLAKLYKSYFGCFHPNRSINAERIERTRTVCATAA